MPLVISGVTEAQRRAGPCPGSHSMSEDSHLDPAVWLVASLSPLLTSSTLQGTSTQRGAAVGHDV